MKYKIIDFHTHAFPEAIERGAVANLEKHYSLNIPRKGDMKHLLISAKECGIEKIVVHSGATLWRQVENFNDWIAQNTGDNIIGFGTIHPDHPDCIGEIRRIKEIGLRGLKLHPDFQRFNIDDPRMYPIYESLEPDFPVLMHLGDEKLDYSSPRRMAKILDLFPNMTVIGAHLGGYGRWNEARKYLVGKNIYLDTSSALWRLSSQEAVSIVRAHGADKVVFGTDYPIASHWDELNRFLSLPLTEEERRKILWDNAAKILKL